jgi:hypothetical protein
MKQQNDFTGEEQYDDRESRYFAYDELTRAGFNPTLNDRYAPCDITCNGFYVDVKTHYSTIKERPNYGITDYKYNKYIKQDKPVFIFVIFRDMNYIVANVKTYFRIDKQPAYTFYDYLRNDEVLTFRST